jgi:hypothetical protein
MVIAVPTRYKNIFLNLATRYIGNKNILHSDIMYYVRIGFIFLFLTGWINLRNNVIAN